MGNDVRVRLLVTGILASFAFGQSPLEQAEKAFDAGRYADAVRLFEKAHEQSPRCDILFFLGMAHYRLKQIDPAMIGFQSAVECDPKLTLAYIALGEAYAERGNDGEAAAAYGQALKLEPRNVDALRGAAAVFMRNKQSQKAVEVLDALVKLQPSDPKAHADLGAAFYAAGNQEAAERQFNLAVRLKPNQVSAMLGLANVYLKKGEGAQATAILQKIVRLVPNAYEPHYLLGTAYNRESKYREALAELQTALRLGGNEPEVYYHLARAYGGLEQPEERRESLLKFAELTKKSKADAEAQRNAVLLVEQAKNLVESGDFNTAVQRLEEARELSPSDDKILFRLASLHYDLKRYETARSYDQEAVSLAPTEWVYRYLLGLIEKQSGRWGQARESLETAAKLNSSAAEVHNALGEVEMHLSDSKAAIASFQRAVDLNPGEVAYKLNLEAAKTAYTAK